MSLTLTWRAALALTLMSAGTASACSPGVHGPGEDPVVTDDGIAYFPGNVWRTARPRDVGMNSSRLDDLESRIRNRQVAEIDGLVIVRRGYVVMEQYSNGSSANQVHEMQSVTKSVASLVVGIAVDQGVIPGVQTRALDFFPEYTDFQNVDERKRAMTAAQLLTMTSGLNFRWNSDHFHRRLNRSTSSGLPSDG